MKLHDLTKRLHSWTVWGLSAVLFVGSGLTIITSAQLFSTRERRVADSVATVFSYMESAYRATAGVYFGEDELSLPPEGSVLTLLEATEWKHVRLKTGVGGQQWGLTLEAEQPPHFVVCGGRKLRLWVTDTPPDSDAMPFGDREPPVAWRLIREWSPLIIYGSTEEPSAPSHGTQ